MLWVPALKPLLLHAAVRVLPAPVRASAPQPTMVVPPSVKFRVPVGALPVTDAVNVTLAPTVEGFNELDSVVVVAVLPPMATETVKRPDGPGVALLTVMVTPVALST